MHTSQRQNKENHVYKGSLKEKFGVGGASETMLLTKLRVHINMGKEYVKLHQEETIRQIKNVQHSAEQLTFNLEENKEKRGWGLVNYSKFQKDSEPLVSKIRNVYR